MNERCFADRKDGMCHALIKKECKGCKFYCPRDKVKDNPFYKYSYDNEYKFVFDTKTLKIPKEYVMCEND